MPVWRSLSEVQANIRCTVALTAGRRFSRTYAPLVTASQDPASIRAAAERAARFVLICGLTGTFLGAGLLIGVYGFAAHPQRVALACIVAAVFAAIGVLVQLYVYRIKIRQASQRLPGDDNYQN